ncbi:hypothetical protein NBRC116594_10010 [Shimia sp. NS0008-38b]|uniref:hypothetical protein n=1 Tax=Shimia sp. NS0008-38b TaxID=3127653 RepID=UPI0031026B8A
MRFFLQILPIMLLAVPAFAQECKIGMAYGHVFNLETGEEIEVTPEDLPNKLREVASCLQFALPDDAKQLNFDSNTLVDLPTLSQLIASFYDVTDEALAQEHIDLAWGLVKRSGLSRSRIEESGTGVGVSVEERDDLHPQLVDQYISNCRAAGVPVPGPIGASDWSEEIDISNDTTLIFTTATEMSIWLHGIDTNGQSTSDGFCVAFKRVLTGDIPIGTICMDEERSKACFFDNLKYVDGEKEPIRMLPEETLTSEFHDMAHVNDSENCSTCHIGDNPLLLHPGTTLHNIFQSGKTKNDDFDFVEFGLNDWCNPDPVASADGCSRCHDISLSSRPVTRNYCSVLRLAANTTMPLSRRSEHSHISLWPDEDGNFEDAAKAFEDYFSSLRELAEMCRSAGGQHGTCNQN